MCKSLQMQGVSLLQLLYATTAHECVIIYFQIENAKECLLSANLNVHCGHKLARKKDPNFFLKRMAVEENETVQNKQSCEILFTKRYEYHCNIFMIE